jgi:SecD/SecF fusion protein
VLIALMHDLLITAGVYALTGREVTVSTVAALLTILGYSLYDTIIVFDRVRENVPRMPRAAFSQIVNRSMSEVLTRSLATSLCTLLPVVALLLFGGETLKDFAFALMVGIASGAYSSIFIASPVLTEWKEREGSYRNRRARLTRDLGFVPAYATTLDGTPIDVEPTKQRRRRGRQGSLIAPEEPGEQVSKEEFEEMVRDLDIEREDGEADAPAPARRGNGGRGRAARGPASAAGTGTVPAARKPSRKAAAPAPAEPQAPSTKPATQDPAADLTPEDLVLKGQPKRQKRARNRRHGRSR